MSECDVVRGYTLRSKDGVLIRIEETPGREEIVLVLQPKGGNIVCNIISARLDKKQWDALVDLKYRVEIHEQRSKEVES